MTIPDKRALRIAWTFLSAVTAIQSLAFLWIFQHRLSQSEWIAHYLFSPTPSLLSWFLALITALGYSAYAARRSPLIGSLILSPRSWKPFIGLRSVALIAAFVTGIFEEFFFRRFLMDAVAPSYGIYLQIALSAIAFGVAHGFWGFFSGNVRGGLGATLATGVLGGLLGIVYIVGGRSLAPCITAHVAINLLIEPWLILAAASGDFGRRPPTGVTL
jgi:membrane protease YdiL (CAAX protease family)